MSFEFSLLYFFCICMKLCLGNHHVIEMSDTGEKHMLESKQKNTSAEQNVLPTLQPCGGPTGNAKR